MRSVQDTYDTAKERPGITAGQWMVMLAAPLLALGLWRLLPDSAITVALLAIAMLAAVFTGVGIVLSSRKLEQEPDREPVPPPSVSPRS
jgi:hypothetical protein